MQATTYAHLDRDTHQLVACDILSAAVLGPASIQHTELIAFLEGMMLPCSTNNFNLGKVFPLSHSMSSVRLTWFQAVQSAGGSDALIDIIYASRITDANTVCQHIRVEIQTSRRAELAAFATSKGFSSPALFLQDVIGDFLKTTGVPDPTAFEQLVGSFCEVQFTASQFDDPSMRSKVLVWAITGQSYLPPEAEQLTVRYLLVRGRACSSQRVFHLAGVY